MPNGINIITSLQSYAVKVIEEMHHQWVNLIDGKSKPGSISRSAHGVLHFGLFNHPCFVHSQHTALTGKTGLLTQAAAQEIVSKKKAYGPPAAIPTEGMSLYSSEH